MDCSKIYMPKVVKNRFSSVKPLVIQDGESTKELRLDPIKGKDWLGESSAKPVRTTHTTDKDTGAEEDGVKANDVAIHVEGGNELVISSQKASAAQIALRSAIRSERYNPENNHIYLNAKIISNTLEVLEFCNIKLL